MDTVDYEGEGRAKHRLIGAAVSLLLAGIATSSLLAGCNKAAPKKPKGEERIPISVPPPMPPPPPPPQPKEEPPEPPEQKEMIEEMVETPNDPEPPSPAEPPALGTGLVGDGPNGFGLGSKGDGGGNGRPGGGVQTSGTRFRAYGKSVESTVQDALRADPKLSKASLNGELLVWIDRTTGRTIRAKLIRSNDTSESIEAARLAATGLLISGSPPADMPLPVRLKINIRPPAL
ncbi:hypothetical protein [Luteolibacter sp. Populi]|uniref:hypothetical protein n=1 Tax=Luteolibacter sp. Populi TaxID=3230487 RepID=UPI0034679C31